MSTPQNLQSSGATLFETVIKVVDPQYEFTKRNITVTGLRLIEEAVELALALGNDPDAIEMAVIDALHNECRKVDKYPSQLRGAKTHDKDSITKELSDVYILSSFIRHMLNIRSGEQRFNIFSKLESLANRARNDELHIVNGRLYKKSAGRG